MREPADAAADAALPGTRSRSRARWWIRTAPQPELPDDRDPSGVRLGLVLAVSGGALFWLLLALGVFWLLRHA